MSGPVPRPTWPSGPARLAREDRGARANFQDRLPTISSTPSGANRNEAEAYATNTKQAPDIRHRILEERMPTRLVLPSRPRGGGASTSQGQLIQRLPGGRLSARTFTTPRRGGSTAGVEVAGKASARKNRAAVGRLVGNEGGKVSSWLVPSWSGLQSARLTISSPGSARYSRSPASADGAAAPR
jgi:hypothetical protein